MQPAIFKDVLLDIVMFPVWWYSRGLLLMLAWSKNTIFGYAKYFAIAVWIKNIFVPMFGQHDWQSRLISVFMRSVQIVGRTIALMIMSVGVALALLIYLVAPILLGLQAAYHVIGSLQYVS
jgi:predicted ferric reductase